MTFSTAALFVVGAITLVAGAELLVRGAARLATRTGMSTVVIGLTVVAFGTSAPELAVSVQAAWRGDGDIAVGNVVGSSIANVLVVIGVSALFTTLVVAQRIVRIDVPIMIGASVIVTLAAIGGVISRWEGALLTVAMVVYLTWTVRTARHSSPAVVEEYEEALGEEIVRRTPLWLDLGYVALGLVLLVAGANWLVTAATDVATALGVSQLVIGLTVVAVGTSLPEIATSVMAAIRGERDLAVGNAIGSNILNLLGVLGIAALVAPDGIAVSRQALSFDMPVMIGVSIACLPIFFNGYVIKKWEGAIFLGFYVAYVTYLVLDSIESVARDPFAIAMLGFVLPLTVITLGIVSWRAWRAHQAAA